MKVLVTGGCGFLGSHVCEYYVSKDDDVVAFDNLTKHELKRTGYDAESAREHVLAFLKALGVSLFEGDVRNKGMLVEASKGCDYIVHTAAQPAMTISIENPELDLSTNVIGTFNVLEAARKHDIPAVFCSSIHVYGNRINEEIREGETRFFRDPPAIDEQHPIMEGTITPLHASKRAAELYVETFTQTYGVKAAIFRLTGIYGPRQFGGEDHGWVANFTIRTMLEKPITLFGTGKQVRDILYVSDAAKAFDAFYEAKVPGIYNIGGGIERAISLIECIDLIELVSGKKADVRHEPKRPGDLWYFVCDIRKAKEKLGWEPEVLPNEGVKRLAEWVGDNMEIFKGQKA